MRGQAGAQTWRPQMGNLGVSVGSTAKPSSNRLRRSQALCVLAWGSRGGTRVRHGRRGPLNKALEELGLKLGVQAFYRSREVVMTIARLTAALTVPTTHPHLIRSQILAVWTC